MNAFWLDDTAIVGDITPSDGVSKEEKNRRESAAMDEMCQLLGGGIQGDITAQRDHGGKDTEKNSLEISIFIPFWSE
jgi:hypothetical protein